MELTIVTKTNKIEKIALLFNLAFRFGWFMVFNATFNNINSVISWGLDLLVEETGETHRPNESH